MELQVREGWRKELAIHFTKQLSQFRRSRLGEEIIEYASLDGEAADAVTTLKVFTLVELWRSLLVHEVMESHQLTHGCLRRVSERSQPYRHSARVRRLSQC